MVASFSKLLQEHITASVFWQPEKNFSSELTMHLPFIFWLMELTQPSSVVQVGAIHPVTYYGYCYAATKLQLETRCSLINLTDHDLNQPAAQLVDIQETFPAITQIIQGHLIETVHHFPNHSIDILHISGATSSQQVEDTITLYKDKLSQKAMILIDHISFLDYAAGKQSLWDKLKTLYPTYAFWHGRGLGIILFGQEPPQNIRHFFAAAEDPIIYAQLRSFFAQQGQNLLGYYAPEEHLKKISEEKEYWKNQAAQLNASLSWRVTQPLRSLSKKIPIIQFIKKILLSSKKKVFQ